MTFECKLYLKRDRIVGMVNISSLIEVDSKVFISVDVRFHESSLSRSLCKRLYTAKVQSIGFIMTFPNMNL